MAVVRIRRDHLAAGRIQGVEFAVQGGDVQQPIGHERLRPDPVARLEVKAFDQRSRFGVQGVHLTVERAHIQNAIAPQGAGGHRPADLGLPQHLAAGGVQAVDKVVHARHIEPPFDRQGRGPQRLFALEGESGAFPLGLDIHGVEDAVGGTEIDQALGIGRRADDERSGGDVPQLLTAFGIEGVKARRAFAIFGETHKGQTSANRHRTPIDHPFGLLLGGKGRLLLAGFRIQDIDLLGRAADDIDVALVHRQAGPILGHRRAAAGRKEQAQRKQRDDAGCDTTPLGQIAISLFLAWTLDIRLRKSCIAKVCGILAVSVYLSAGMPSRRLPKSIFVTSSKVQFSPDPTDSENLSGLTRVFRAPGHSRRD